MIVGARAVVGPVLVAVAVVLAVVAVPRPAMADAPPTISGPSAAGYFATVTLAGTAQPGQQVDVWFRRPFETAYVLRRHAVANPSGRWSLTYQHTSDTGYYAVANGARSAFGATRLAGSSCSVSKPAFTADPAGHSGVAGVDHYVAFTYTKNNVWYGYAYNRGTPYEYDVISWHSGQAAPIVIDRFAFDAKSDLNALGGKPNIIIAGVTPTGALVVAVGTRPQVVDYSYNYQGYVYLDGHRYTLRTSPRSSTAQPSSVSANGTIGGIEGSTRPAGLATWASKRAPVVIHAQLFGDDGYARAAIDDQGDLVHNWGTDGAVTRAGHTGVQYLGGAAFVVSGNRVFAGSGGQGGAISVWDLTHAPNTETIPPTSQPIPASPDTADVMAAGRRGDFTMDVATSGRAHYWTVGGGFATLPLLAGVGQHAGEAIDANGTLAVTFRSDGLVHFLVCH